MYNSVRIIGGGLAGAEAAWQLARRGVAVELFEMRPQRMTEAHASGNLGELVCSNSLRSDLISAPAGLLKAEMRQLDSLVVRCAEITRVPAGSALAVDREQFSRALTHAVEELPTVRVVREEAQDIPNDGIVILATGPLTSPALSRALAARLGEEHLYFYDAISPIVSAESIDMNVAFRAARYDKGGDDYLNLPMTREQYDGFISALSKKWPIAAAKRSPSDRCGRWDCAIRAPEGIPPRSCSYAKKTRKDRSTILSVFKPR
jgi:methylenetetrahydrofolate--tRNA-(uracil-5-)-methyltransferase